MSSHLFFDDELKAEKADAMRRFKRQRIVLFCMRLAGALALVLLCCSPAWILGFKGLASQRLSVLRHQFCAFFVINVILLLVYRLSADCDANSKKGSAVRPDLYDEYVSFSSSASNATVRECKQLVVSPPAPHILSEEVAFQNKRIVVCETVDYSVIDENHSVRELAVVVANDCAAVKAQEEEEEEKHYRRTRSELITREKTSRGRQLRRSETENNRRQSARKSMEDMNSEEFRLTIESFIAAKKKILRDENNALLSRERRAPSAIFTSL